MTEPYFTGDNVPLKFKIADSEGVVQPSAASVVIVYPMQKKITEPADADIEATTPYAVSYKVPSSVTTMAGEYHVFFVCTLPSGERTYQMNFIVLSNPR